MIHEREARLLFHIGWCCGVALACLFILLGMPPFPLGVVAIVVCLVRMYQLGGEVRKETR